MFRLIAVTALVAFFSGHVQSFTPSLDGRIIGGKDTTIEEYPYQISLQMRGRHICGGSIISSKFIVTAAHCTYGKTAPSFTIRAGSSKHASGGITVGVKKIYQHLQYNPWITDYDVSVLELATELQFGASIQPVDLPKLDQEIAVGSPAVCSGWGTTSEGGNIPSQLKTVTVNIVDKNLCRGYYAGDPITDRMFCAGVPKGGKDACQGDSGGPLVANGELVGIVSWGYGCAREEYPGIYASVSNLRNYIKKCSGI